MDNEDEEEELVEEMDEEGAEADDDEGFEDDVAAAGELLKDTAGRSTTVWLAHIPFHILVVFFEFTFL